MKMFNAPLFLFFFLFTAAIPCSALMGAIKPAPTTVKSSFENTEPQFLEVRPLEEKGIPNNELGKSIRLGYQLVTQTKLHAKDYVGNGLSCTNCHLDAGRKSHAAPFIGVWGVFPEYRSRNGKVNMLSDRINDCFLRSMNGKALPENSPEMAAISSYIWWLSREVPTGQSYEGRGFKTITPPRPPNKVAGKKVFEDKCMSCHGIDGAGLKGDNGETLIPPLWGDQSFNIGAGMARLNTAAAFIAKNMPLGNAGTLTPQEAYDVALYVIEGNRPDYADKKFDWPKGDKPKDARY